MQNQTAFPKIILASGSPRRRSLLELAEIPFVSIVPNCDESLETGLDAESLTIALSLKKAMAAKAELLVGINAGKFPSSYLDLPIVAADTLVTADNKIIGKPDSLKNAQEILQFLSGRVHEVVTGITIYQHEVYTQCKAITVVEMYELTEYQVLYYVEKYKPLDKAAAYGIQEWIGLTGVKSISGDYYNVMGLPVALLIRELRNFGVFVI